MTLKLVIGTVFVSGISIIALTIDSKNLRTITGE
jgi:hypothetical protein